MSYIQGMHRGQATMFPEALEDLIEPDAPVRVIDAFVASLDLEKLGFVRGQPAATGRPGYDPADLLKLYVYGYLNQLRSSRRLEREAKRNVEVLWLLHRLQPDFKTIADFRKDNAEALVGVCRAFTLFCREQGLFGGLLVAIDGSKFQAVASRAQVWTKQRLVKAQGAIEQRIREYLSRLDKADAQELGEGEANTQAALERLAGERERLQSLAQQLSASGRKQLVAGEEEAQLMRMAHGQHAAAYNVQSAVDAQHALVACFEVTNECNDQRQLAPMALQAKQALGVAELTVVADTGYSNGEQAAQCAAAGITAVVPAQKPTNPEGDYFTKDQFVYDAQQDQYRCPAGQILRRYRVNRFKQCVEYRARACDSCALRARCTPARYRTIVRPFFTEWMQRMDARAKAEPQLLRRRSALAEHPFAGMKRLMGQSRFLVRGLKKATAEMSLCVLGYNLKRVIAIRGPAALIQAWA